MTETFSGVYDTESYKVLNYMYCHPKNVVIRKGSRKLLRWQHVIGVSNLEFSTCYTKTESQLNSLILRQRSLVFESLDPLKKLISRGLHVRNSNNWISFKWTTGKGNTQFQIQMCSSEETRKLLRALSEGGIKVYYNQFSKESPIEWAHHGSKNSQIDCALSQRCSQTQVESNPQQFEHLVIGDNCRNSFSQTQCWSQSQTQADSQIPLWQPDLPREMMDIRTSSFGNQSECVSFGSSSSLNPKYNLTPEQYIPVHKLIDEGNTVHINIEAFSFAKASAQQVNRLKWNHVGLASNINLSLVVMNRSRRPELMLNRGCVELAKLLVGRHTLRAFLTRNLVILCHATEGSLGPRNFFQLQMKPKDVTLLCSWLSYWHISVEDPSTTLPATEATTLNSWGHPPVSRTSGISEISKSSVYWNSRLRPHSNHSLISRSSRFS